MGFYSAFKGLSWSLEGGGLSTPRPDLSTASKDPVPIVQEPGWALCSVWTGVELLPATGFDPRTAQAVTTPCTFVYESRFSRWYFRVSHLVTGFSRFPCVYKQTLRRFPTFQVATTCFSCSPPGLKSSSNQFHVLFTCKITTATG